jgi:hypothetical protein
MKHLTNIIVSNLGVDYTKEDSIVQNGHDFIVFKKFQEDFFIIMKDSNELSELLTSNEDVTNWINTHA